MSKYSARDEQEYEFFEDSAEYPFQPQVDEFRLANAWWLMDAAMLAYSSRRVVEHWCRKAGFRNVDWFSEGGTQCFIASRDEYIFVVFRGTDPPRRLRNFIVDWRINFRTSLVDFDGHGCVHRGFLKALDKVSSSTSSGGDMDLQSRIESIARQHPRATLWFTGHSQGAALATLAAVRHVRRGGRAQVYTFGSPRVGDRTFQHSYPVQAWRVVNSSDIVTRLWGFGFYKRAFNLFKWPFFGVYQPVGELRFIDDNGDVGPKQIRIRQRFRLLRWLPRKVKSFYRRFTNHAPIHYAIRLSNAMANAEANTFPVPAGREFVYPWPWWKRLAFFTPLVLILGGALLFAVRFYWFPERPDDPRPVTILENGLGGERELFYSLPEGSEMFPVAVAEAIRMPEEEIRELALGNPKPSGIFRSALSFFGSFGSWMITDQERLLDNLEQFGFIKVPRTDVNELGYIGLTVSTRKGTGVKMLGVNCAACHVGQIEHNGEAIRIDGAPNQLDIFGFVQALSKSVKLPHVNGFIVVREVGVVVKEATFSQWSDYLDQLIRHRKLRPNPMPLKGRADAFGTARAMFFGDFRELSSPASYPHIWGLDKTLWYHWNANTNSILQRNVGQALGLGAGIDLATCETTIMFDKVEELERLAGKLTAPVWPTELGSIDPTKRALGEQIYLGAGPYKESGNCARCHDTYTKTVDHRNDYQLFSLKEVGTDPNEALNFMPGVQVSTGVCKGNDPKDTKYMQFDEAHEVLLGRVRYDMPVDNAADVKHNPNGAREKPAWKTRAACDGGECEVYPAKPLVGIWATAPYLHNGSVPSIWDLLQPHSKRPKEFVVGERQYDPDNLGYKQAELDPEKYQIFNTTLNGNLNTGHEYGTNLSDPEKRALIEYLKSLKPGDEEKLYREKQ